MAPAPGINPFAKPKRKYSVTLASAVRTFGQVVALEDGQPLQVAQGSRGSPETEESTMNLEDPVQLQQSVTRSQTPPDTSSALKADTPPPSQSSSAKESQEPRDERLENDQGMSQDRDVEGEEATHPNLRSKALEGNAAPQAAAPTNNADAQCNSNRAPRAPSIDQYDMRRLWVMTMVIAFINWFLMSAKPLPTLPDNISVDIFEGCVLTRASIATARDLVVSSTLDTRSEMLGHLDNISYIGVKSQECEGRTKGMTSSLMELATKMKRVGEKKRSWFVPTLQQIDKESKHLEDYWAGVLIDVASLEELVRGEYGVIEDWRRAYYEQFEKSWIRAKLDKDLASGGGRHRAEREGVLHSLGVVLSSVSDRSRSQLSHLKCLQAALDAMKIQGCEGGAGRGDCGPDLAKQWRKMVSHWLGGNTEVLRTFWEWYDSLMV